MVIYGDKVFENDKYVVYDNLGRLYLLFRTTVCQTSDTPPILHGDKCGILVNGMHGLDTRYGGDFEKWIKNVEKRELKTMKSYYQQAQQLMKMAQNIQKMHGFSDGQMKDV